ncbi:MULTISPECIES: signal peptide peptidase SppA [unclassified Sulfuricurvum]|uniref:signal peptide peptidase SppA n=1 Tax=unclassified Sulfuricurvum TaxID=2632390 RepID=UPI0002999E4B|nr:MULTISPECIES: signal peptide peptidase SppA [unclassified Sulfuricurvum]AFV96784.1 signal peptide peptidase sppa, 36k type [Candidatus Sulfuricurvum sp. RIFRC-1]
MMEIIKKIGSCLATGLRFIQGHFKATVLVLFVLWLILPSGDEGITPHNLQKITLTGPILDATTIVEQLDEARENEDIKGVMFSIDSPGGAVAPSVEIAYAIKRLSETKPTVVYAAGIMASGGYYSAIWGNEIIANPGSMIGSIGVIMQGADLSELMEKVGVKTQVVHAGTYKQVGTFDRKWSDEERAELDKVIGGTYELFVGDVARARGLPLNKSSEYADAHIFTAAQAQKVGLVDSIGVEFDAKKRVEALSKVAEPIWNKEDPMDKFFKRFAAEGASLAHMYFPPVSLQ